jgi:hypothetical protein
LLTQHEKQSKEPGVYGMSLGQINDDPSLEPDRIPETSSGLVDVFRRGGTTKLNGR